jgi:catalase
MKKRSSRSTSGPAAGSSHKAPDATSAPPPHSRDTRTAHAHEVDALARAIPFNRTKAAEHGRENAMTPPAGATVEPPSPSTGASTLSETSASAKTGQAAAPGVHAVGGALDRVRSDATGHGLTTNQGLLVGDNQNSLKAGLRGPALLEDFILREKITHFDHERIPERIVHARGSAAHGYFESYDSLGRLTRAAPFAEAGKRTPVFVRFSTVAGERGSIDTARDVRGFAVKFYTDEGNWDLVGNNIPVFFIQDAMKFPDLVHAVKPEPHHGMPQAASAHDTFWDFVSLMPESTHMLMWVMSDRAIPRSYRMMQGFGVHSYRLVTAEGDAQFVKFHWRPTMGTHSLVWDEAVKLAGADPDYHRRDLWDAIEGGDYPEWELGLQLFSEEEAERFSFDVLDATKLIPEELVPLIPVGRLVLNRNPDNFFAETEQVAFCTSNVIPGIDFSNDPLLAGRIHSYVDTQLSRLGGPNFHEIPINAPLAAVHNNQRDGLHRQTVHRGRVAYEPNSLGGGCPFQGGRAGFVSFPQPTSGEKLRGKPEKFAEHYAQARLFYESQSPVEQAHILGAFRFELSKVTVPSIRERMVASLANASAELAEKLALQLGMRQLPTPLPIAAIAPVTPEVDRSPALSLLARPGEEGIRTRRIAMLVADGALGDALARLRAGLMEEGALVSVVAPRLGSVTTADDVDLVADASVDTTPSVLYDAVVLTDGREAVERLLADGRMLEFVKDQYRHCKSILVLGESGALLDRCGIPTTLDSGEDDPGILVAADGDDEATFAQFVLAIAAHRHWARETDPPRV